jgi:hypothetical protein
VSVLGSESDGLDFALDRAGEFHPCLRKVVGGLKVEPELGSAIQSEVQPIALGA